MVMVYLIAHCYAGVTLQYKLQQSMIHDHRKGVSMRSQLLYYVYDSNFRARIV